MRFIVRFIAVTIIFVVVAAIFCVESVGVWIDIGVGCRRIFVFRVVFSCLAESCNAEIDMRNVLLSTRASSCLRLRLLQNTAEHSCFVLRRWKGARCLELITCRLCHMSRLSSSRALRMSLKAISQESVRGLLYSTALFQDAELSPTNVFFLHL